eukprot:6474019-Amphidinium_carterae.2
MLGHISPARLEAYREHIRRYAERFGHPCWPIIYQSDVRARLEHVVRLRRQAEESHDQLRLVGSPSPYDASKPWEVVFDMLVRDIPFWKVELEDAAMLILTKSNSLHSMLGDDAPIQATANKRVADEEPRARATAKPKMAPGSRQHNLHPDTGDLRTNRRGVPLCEAFNRGECTATTLDNRCANAPHMAHQCSRCLSIHHGVHQCTQEKPSLPRPNMGKGKAKGKGRSAAN